MSTRIRKPETKSAVIEPSEEVFTSPSLPLLAASVFCDDARLESTGKITLVGCYPGNVIIVEPLQPIDRIWVFTRLTWHTALDPGALRMRVDFPAQASGYMNVQANPTQRDGLAHNAISVWQLRFHPLRPGDVLRVCVEQGDSVLTCGELLAIAATLPTRH